MRASMKDVLEPRVCWTCFDVSAEAVIDLESWLPRRKLLLRRLPNDSWFTAPFSSSACSCCLTGLTCQVPLRSSFANLVQPWFDCTFHLEADWGFLCDAPPTHARNSSHGTCPRTTCPHTTSSHATYSCTTYAHTRLHLGVLGGRHLVEVLR